MSEQQHSTEAMENIDVSSYFALGLLAQYYRNRKQGLYYRNNILPFLLTETSFSFLLAKFAIGRMDQNLAGSSTLAPWSLPCTHLFHQL